MERPEIEINFYPSSSERLGDPYNRSILSIYHATENAGGRAAIKNPTKDLIIGALIVSGPILVRGLCACLNSWIKAKRGRSIQIVVEGLTLKTKGLSPKALRGLIKDAENYRREERKALSAGKPKRRRKRKRPTQD